MKLSKLALSVAVAAGIGAGVPSGAQADALSTGGLLISNFAFYKTTGTVTNNVFTPGTAFDVTDFSSLNFVDTLTNNSNMSGFPSSSQSGSVTGFGGLDQLAACSGSGCAPFIPNANNFTMATPPPTSLYARSDSVLAGAPITGTSPIPFGVTANTFAETSLNAAAVGGSTSNILLSASLSFVLAQAANNAQIVFDAEQLLQAWTSAGSKPGTLAGASTNWSINLTDAAGNDIFHWDPDGTVDTSITNGTEVFDSCDLNHTVSAPANSPNPGSVCSGLFVATLTQPLQAGVLYSLAISQIGQSNAVTVPEPSSVALVGIALLGLWAGRREWSRRQKA